MTATSVPGIRPRPDRGRNVWQLRYRGHSEYFTGTLAAAKKHYPIFRALHDGAPAKSDVTFGQVLDRWLASVRAKEREANTLRGYEQHVRALKAWELSKGRKLGDVLLVKLRPDHLERFYNHLTAKGRAATTVARYHSSVRSALNFAVYRGWVMRNVALGTDRPTVKPAEIEVPTPAEVRAILAAGEAESDAHGVFLRVVAATWARRGEVIALRDQDVHLDRAEILIESSVAGLTGGGVLHKDTKSHARRLISIDAGTVALLKKWRKHREAEAKKQGVKLVPGSYLFSEEGNGSRAWHPDTGGDVFERAQKAAGIEGYHLHCLRHFGATQALAAGVPITTVSHRLGHKNVMTTLNIYAHWIPATDQLASGLMGNLLEEPLAIEAADEHELDDEDET